jgi:hypothetical protein
MAQGSDDIHLYLIVGIPLLVCAAGLLTRRLVVQKVRQLMMAPSGVVEPPPPAAPAASEVAAPRTPRWQVVDTTTPLPDATATRDVLSARAKADVAAALWHELAIAGAYVVVPLAVYAFPGEKAWDGSEGSVFISSLGVMMLCFLAVARYLGFRSQFRAYVSGLAGVFRPFATTMLQIAQPAWRAPIWGIFIAVVLVHVGAAIFGDRPAPRTALAYSLAVAAHLAIAYRLLNRARRTPNVKLLVLRVFGIDDTAVFTFEGLLQYWRHFGTFFTVVDPTFIHSQYRQGSGLVTAVILSAVGTIAVVAGSKNPEVLAWWLLLAVVAGAAVHMHLSLRKTERQFLRSAADVAVRLRHLDDWPRELDLSFKSLPMMCHDNVWKVAVSQTAQVSAVVLMDLRGFAAERKGCQYEVDFLLDNVPLARIVFLVDTQDAERVQALILESWRLLKATSPNVAAATPQVTLYMASNQDAKDIQGILDQLLFASQHRSPGKAAA